MRKVSEPHVLTLSKSYHDGYFYTIHPKMQSSRPESCSLLPVQKREGRGGAPGGLGREGEEVPAPPLLENPQLRCHSHHFCFLHPSPQQEATDASPGHCSCHQCPQGAKLPGCWSTALLRPPVPPGNGLGVGSAHILRPGPWAGAQGTVSNSHPAVVQTVHSSRGACCHQTIHSFLG